MSKIRHDMQKYKPYQRWFTVREFYTMRAAVVFWIFPLLILWLASSSYQVSKLSFLLDLKLITLFQFKLRVTALKCELKTPSIQNCSCVLKPINRTLSIMNIDCFMPNPLKQMLLNIVSFRRFPSGYKQFWINQTEDFCAYQNGKPALLIDSVLKSSKHLLYNTKCPIQVKQSKSQLVFSLYFTLF